MVALAGAAIGRGPQTRDCRYRTLRATNNYAIEVDLSTGLWTRSHEPVIHVLASYIDGMALRSGWCQANALWQGRRVRLGGVPRCRRAWARGRLPIVLVA